MKPSALGDIVHTLPIVVALKKHYPHVHLAWVVSRNFQDILEENPYIDELITFERQKWGGIVNTIRHFAEIRAFIRIIREARFDIVLDFQGLLRSALITLFANSPCRIGFANAREWAYLSYTHKIEAPAKAIHAVDRYKLLLRYFGIHEAENIFPIAISLSHKKRAAEWLPKSPVLAMAPGARWETKRWPAEYFAIVSEQMARECDAATVLVGSEEDRKIGQEILRRVERPETIINLIGKTSLRDLAAVLAKSDIVLSNDSGPMHISAAVNTPTLGVLGPTDPKKIRPYGEIHRVIKNDLCARDCWRACRHRIRCLKAITPQQVVSQLKELLSVNKKCIRLES